MAREESGARCVESEGGVKPSRCKVHTRRGADNPERRQPLPVGDQESNRWEA